MARDWCGVGLWPGGVPDGQSIARTGLVMAPIVRLLDYSQPHSGYVDLTSLPMPKQGGKVWLLERKGRFLMERGPGTLRTICCTGAGSGTISIYDGIIDENGQLPGRDCPLIYKANPAVMGSWMLDAGFTQGLTIVHMGGPVPATASIVWVPYLGARK